MHSAAFSGVFVVERNINAHSRVLVPLQALVALHHLQFSLTIRDKLAENPEEVLRHQPKVRTIASYLTFSDGQEADDRPVRHQAHVSA